ncbi:MAG: hypothetical protein HY929_00490 [Euryarchaeota archaeon]|nr:hypothetical protein [Euryarchaeota archaeon]
MVRKEELEKKLKEAKTVEEKLKIMIEADEAILRELKEQRDRLEALSFQTKTIKELWGLSVAEKAIETPTNPEKE